MQCDAYICPPAGPSTQPGCRLSERVDGRRRNLNLRPPCCSPSGGSALAEFASHRRTVTSTLSTPPSAGQHNVVQCGWQEITWRKGWCIEHVRLGVASGRWPAHLPVKKGAADAAIKELRGVDTSRNACLLSVARQHGTERKHYGILMQCQPSARALHREREGAAHAVQQRVDLLADYVVPTQP